MSDTKKTILFILMPEKFQDTEFLEPYSMLQKAGHTVKIAGLKPGIATGAFGRQQPVDLVLSTMQHADFDAYDAVVIPGGPGSTLYLWGNKAVQTVVRYFHENKKLVATICYACIVPVQAGLLKGKMATVYPTNEAKEILAEQGVIFSDQGCVVDSGVRIITAQGPKFATMFGQAILDFLH